MELSRARFLVSGEGRAALAGLAPGLDRLTATALATLLRKSFAPEEAAALAEQVTLRAKAGARLTAAQAGWVLSREGSEMMTHPLVAGRRAARLAELGVPVADLTCGIGGDLSAIAGLAERVVGVDRDAATALLAGANVTAASVVRGEATRPPFAIDRMAALIDPSRRDDQGSRTFDPARFSPTFDAAIALATEARAGVVKGPPGLDRENVPDECEFEAVQVGRTLRETALWFGSGSEEGLRRAVLLPVGATLDSNETECPPEPVAPGTVVYDPQSCVTRAGLVRHLGNVLGARMLDRQVAYLGSDVAVAHPMAEAFEVLDVLPFSLAGLRQRMRAGHWRTADVRRRAFPVEPAELVRLLGRLEGEPVTILCTTLAGKRTVIIGRAISSGAPVTRDSRDGSDHG